MTRELLGRVSKASQELFGQNAGLRALRMFETFVIACDYRTLEVVVSSGSSIMTFIDRRIEGTQCRTNKPDECARPNCPTSSGS